MLEFKNLYLRFRNKVLSSLVRKKLDLSDITLISMNCIGGIVYHDLGQKFLTPTVNLYFTPSDFLKFVENLDEYLSITPKVTMGKEYPVGELGDIKIYFMHYDTCEDALAKWEERKQRIVADRIFVIMVDRDGFTINDFERFQRIHYPKLLFTRGKEYKGKDVFFMSKYKHLEQIPDIIPGRHIYDKMRLIKAINKVYRYER